MRVEVTADFVLEADFFMDAHGVLGIRGWNSLGDRSRP
jgi:hypothetical protein